MEAVNQLTKITIAWELFEQGIPKAHIAKQLGVTRETVHLWIKAATEAGLIAFLEDYTNAKRGERAKRKLDGLLKKRVYRLREDNRDCCGQKIKEFLLSEYGVELSTTTIYKILAEKYKLRSKWKKNQARGPVPKASNPREVVQMDSVDFGQVFAFTGVDICSKEVAVKLYESLTAKEGLDFLNFSLAADINMLSYSKLMEVVNSRLNLDQMSFIMLIGLGSQGHTRRMNNHILRALTDP